MSNTVKAFWFRIDYGTRQEVVISTAISLQAALDRIQTAQQGRLTYHPRGPRIRRITALHPATRDRAFIAFLDNVLRLENSQGTATPDA